MEKECNKEILNELYRIIRTEEGQRLKMSKMNDADMRRFIEKQIELAVKKEERDEIQTNDLN